MVSPVWKKESNTPAEAFWVAIAGPLVSLLIFGLIPVINLGNAVSGPLAVILGVLTYANLALALFNLIPGLPLDGGNILKALVWKITGNPYKGVLFASRVGQLIGWIAVISGIIPLLFGSFGNFWNLLIGWFLLQNAGRAAQSATVQEKLRGLTAADAVTPNSPVVSAHLSLRDFADESILGNTNWQQFLVTDESLQLVGTLKVEDLKIIPTSRWSETQVKDLMQPIEQAAVVQSNQSLLEAIMLLEKQQRSALPVIRENGVLVGILEKVSVVRLLQGKVQTNPA